MNTYQSRLTTLIEQVGGRVDTPFVEDPGAMLVKSGETLTSSGSAILEQMHISTEQNDTLRLAEFAARITYLAFPQSPESSQDAAAYHDRLRSLGHCSPYRLWHKSHVFFVAGCSIETSLELVAHHEGTVARLTSSRTHAMDEPLFRVQGSPVERARTREIITAMLTARMERQLEGASENWNEFFNMTAPSDKVTALLIGMDFVDWHRTFIGRFDVHGVETEVREICARMRAQLEDVDEDKLILTEEEYYALGNAAKQALPQ